MSPNSRAARNGNREPPPHLTMFQLRSTSIIAAACMLAVCPTTHAATILENTWIASVGSTVDSNPEDPANVLVNLINNKGDVGDMEASAYAPVITPSAGSEGFTFEDSGGVFSRSHTIRSQSHGNQALVRRITSEHTLKFSVTTATADVTLNLGYTIQSAREGAGLPSVSWSLDGPSGSVFGGSVTSTGIGFIAPEAATLITGDYTLTLTTGISPTTFHHSGDSATAEITTTNFTLNAVPEPSVTLMTAVGFLLMVGRHRRR